jgi:histidine ammonia-lyase
VEGREVMERAGINLVQLDLKEGIALDNGTQLKTAIAALTVCGAENLVKTPEITTALSLEALLGISDAFDERIHVVRPHKGQVSFHPGEHLTLPYFGEVLAKVLNILYA